MLLHDIRELMDVRAYQTLRRMAEDLFARSAWCHLRIGTYSLSDFPFPLVYQYAHKERPVERARAVCGGKDSPRDNFRPQA